MRHPTALVIGAGIGGITAAARLARHGYSVTVVEKNAQPGGRCGRLIRDGHQIDLGATLYLMPEIYARTFADLGCRIEDHLDLRRVDPTYRIHFADGSALALTSDLSAMKAQLEAMEPGSFAGFLRYLEEGCIHYRLAMPHLVDRNFRNLLEFANLKNLYLLFKLKALVKHYANIGNYFNDPRLKAAFTFQDMYMGLSPYKAPALYSFLQYTELAEGIWFPIGGMYSIVEALTGIAERMGVIFHYDAPVRQIKIDGRKATGVCLADGREIQAEVVVANADLAYVYRSLLPDDGTADRLARKRYGCSAVIFYWGLNTRFPQLGAHNLFLAEDYRQSFDPIFEQLTLPDDPSFYVHVPTRTDPSTAPDGCDTFAVAFPVGHIDEAAQQDWATIQKRARQVALRRLAQLGITDLEQHIKFEFVATPDDWQREFNLVNGSTHGLSHDLMQMAYFRPHNRHARYRNLFFVGASTHPGTGIATVLISARLVTERILEEIRQPRRLAVVAPTTPS